MAFGYSGPNYRQARPGVRPTGFGTNTVLNPDVARPAGRQVAFNRPGFGPVPIQPSTGSGQPTAAAAYQPAAAPPPGPVAQTPAAPSPYDAQYFQDLANATFKANEGINQSNLTSANARTNLANAFAQMHFQQGLQTTADQNAENARGGFAQGHLGETLGNLNQGFLDRQGNAQTAFDQGEAGRSAARAALASGLSITQAALAAAAADRASAAAAKNPLPPVAGSTPAALPPNVRQPSTLLAQNTKQNTFGKVGARVRAATNNARRAF